MLQNNWQATHGKMPGFYLKTAGIELYVRQDDERADSWLWYADGDLRGAEGTEARARAQAEAFARGTVVRAGAAAKAAAARQLR